MNKLYKKSELTFALVIIGIYVVLFSLADGVSESIGLSKIITAPVALIFSLLLFIWISKNKLNEKYGLCIPEIRAKDYLYFLPLVLISSSNIWWGVSVRLAPVEVLMYIISMICVGFIEEVIFRGFLFKALCVSNIKTAVAVSSVTFGVGHVVNLLNGAELLPTLLQICYACAAGFMFTVIFYKSGSLIPCVVTHSLINSLSVFSTQRDTATQLISALLLTVIPVVYTYIIYKKTADSRCNKNESNT